ncbi:hypothetical protein E3T61_19830 [Cryobacterium lactosi]|uniref:Uncharacterized protein n=1 Tax=Cryobacterium lactosi TaxID=1259202 RepID=A0A4R9BGI7_9MICO|nr:hypothetical protein [Cryobacterium lactosi]TFD84024.1 hypothetical protein E3T61_19830 [Cryobacterium lactosi]
MTEARNSAKQSTARARAREKAAEFRAKQDKLEQLATDYFVAADSLEGIETATHKEVAAVHDRAAKQSLVVRQRAATAIASMLELGTSRSEVADRLGVALREVKKTQESS